MCAWDTTGVGITGEMAGGRTGGEVITGERLDRGTGGSSMLCLREGVRESLGRWD